MRHAASFVVVFAVVAAFACCVVKAEKLVGATFPGDGTNDTTWIVLIDGETGSYEVLNVIPKFEIPEGGVVDTTRGVYMLVVSGPSVMSFNLTDGSLISKVKANVKNLEGITFDEATGNVYATTMNPIAGGSHICQYNYETGDCVNVVELPQAVGYYVSAVAWNQVDRQYIHIYDWKTGSSYENKFIFVDIAKQAPALEVPVDTVATALSYDNVKRRLLTAEGSKLSNINLTTGVLEPLCTLPGGITENGGFVVSKDGKTGYISHQYYTDYQFTVVDISTCTVLIDRAPMPAPIYYLSAV